MLLIFLVFCVVRCFFFFVGWVGVYIDHFVSFLCCVLFFGFFKGGSMLLILLVFCVVVFLGGVYVVDLVSFLCCVLFFCYFLLLGGLGCSSC